MLIINESALMSIAFAAMAVMILFYYRPANGGLAALIFRLFLLSVIVVGIFFFAKSVIDGALINRI
jgi:hypothetical protein